MSGSGISWAICKSAPRSRQITTPAPDHSVLSQAGCTSCRPTNSVRALKATSIQPMHSAALAWRRAGKTGRRRTVLSPSCRTRQLRTARSPGETVTFRASVSTNNDRPLRRLSAALLPVTSRDLSCFSVNTTRL